MTSRIVTWPTPIRNKLLSYRSPRFTAEETFDFIANFILKTEDILKDDIVGKFYTEPRGRYRGISRMVVHGFKVYFEIQGDEVVILAVKFPREN